MPNGKQALTTIALLLVALYVDRKFVAKMIG